MIDVRQKTSLTEERLTPIADSLGDLLEQLRGRIPTQLIAGHDWERVLTLARGFPVTFAGFPHGFELPLHEARPSADLGITLVGSTRSGDYFERKAQEEDVEPYVERIIRLLGKTVGDTPLRQICGRKTILEFDIASAPGEQSPEPGFFLRGVERLVTGGRGEQGQQDVCVMLDGIAVATGWDLTGYRRCAEQVYQALGPDTRIESLGVFPARDKSIRFAVAGFRCADDIGTFLERIDWQGNHSTITSTASRFAARKAFAYLSVHIDVQATGIGPTLGLGFMTRDMAPTDGRYWIDSPKYWSTLIKSMREDGLGLPDKLSALAGWSTPAELLYGNAGAVVLMRGIHHIKLVSSGDHFDKVKGYVFMLMGALPQQEGSSGA